MEKRDEEPEKKKKSQSIDVAEIGKLLTKFLSRYHSLLFFILLAIGVGVCIIIIIEVLNVSSVIDVSGIPAVNQNFDEQTIQQIDQLKDRNNTGNFTLPSGRTNPFVE